MSSKARFIVVAGLAAVFTSGCGDSAGDVSGGIPEDGARKVTFYLEGMGTKLKLM